MSVPYPLSVFSLDTQITPRPSIEVDPATDGTVRGRVIQDQTVVDATLVHGELTTAERDTLLAFYAANRTNAIDVIYAGSAYLLYFVGRPKHAPRDGGGNLWRVEVAMIGGIV